MKRFFIMSVRKKATLFSVVLLVVISTVLVAQNPLPENEVTPEKNRQGENVSELFLRIHENDIQNPLINQIVNFQKKSAVFEDSVISDYAFSPDRMQIFYNVYSYDSNVDSKLYYLKIGMKKPKFIGYASNFFEDSFYPFQVQYWLNNSMVLLAAGNPVSEKPDLIAVYDISTFSIKKLPRNYRFFSAPVPYDNGTKLFYYVEIENEFLDPGQKYSFDLITGKETQISNIPKEVQNEGNLLEIESSTNGCLLSGSPPLYLPWTCNIAMCVERDGPQPCEGYNCVHKMKKYDMDVEYIDCPLNPGLSYEGPCNDCPTVTCGHSLPAIDFGNAELWDQTDPPILASVDGEAQKRYQGPPKGAGNYVVIKSPRNGGGFVFTYYMHMSTVANNIPEAPNWIQVFRGDQIGVEGATGDPNYSPHYHFQLKDADLLGHSFYPVFAEYGGCTPKTGRTYFSRNVPTNGSMQNGFDCNAVTDIPCNAVLTGQTTVGYASRYATYGNGYHSWDEYGSERIYRITTTDVATINVSLSNVPIGVDLNVFILASTGSCSDLDPLIDIRGVTSNSTATYSNAPVGTYYLIVDGRNGSAGSFTLNVDTPCQPCSLTSITFSTQAQIDAFSSNYPGCTQIPGYVNIADGRSGNIANLNGLSQITSVGGDLEILNNSALTSLTGLNALTSIGGSLDIINNPGLTNLMGLGALTSIGDYLEIENNPGLTSLTGLRGCAKISYSKIIVWSNGIIPFAMKTFFVQFYCC